MSSIRDTIAGLAVTALQGSGKPSGLNVHRFRARPIGSDELPAALVYLVREDVETKPGFAPGAVAVRNLTLRVEHRIDAGSSTAPDAALDQYVSWGVKAICAANALGTNIIDVQELSTERAAVEEDKVYAAAQTDFRVRYITLATNPDAQSL